LIPWFFLPKHCIEYSWAWISSARFDYWARLDSDWWRVRWQTDNQLLPGFADAISIEVIRLTFNFFNLQEGKPTPSLIQNRFEFRKGYDAAYRLLSSQ
jgi:hypothetical protein